MKRHIFLLTYNEADMFVDYYTSEFVQEHFQDYHFVILDNGKQKVMRDWAIKNNFTYYASEYNIGSSGGYNWMFKVARLMKLHNAVIMQADVQLSNSYPLDITFNLTEEFGEHAFIIWPQIMDHNTGKPYANCILPNLGNFVGFNPVVMRQKDCYFDENYVVTHFDDLEFVRHCKITGKMKTVDVCQLLGWNTDKHQYNVKEIWQDMKMRPFVIETPMFQVKIMHASQSRESHNPWFIFNKPYYDTIYYERKGERLPYDPSRWTQFGYPEYPVQHEIDRFKQLFPHLV